MRGTRNLYVQPTPHLYPNRPLEGVRETEEGELRETEEGELRETEEAE